MIIQIEKINQLEKNKFFLRRDQAYLAGSECQKEDDGKTEDATAEKTRELATANSLQHKRRAVISLIHLLCPGETDQEQIVWNWPPHTLG